MDNCHGKPGALAEVPNVLLATSYALNKSNTKRVCVGLEHSGGYCRSVIKFITSGPSYKNVTLIENSWKDLRDRFDTIIAYFGDAYTFYPDFGRPTKIFLNNHDLNFTSAYGNKSITIDERPQPTQYEDEEPSCKKKKKYFEGLRKQGNLINLRLAMLKQQVGKVNRTLDYILAYLKNKLQEEGQTSCRTFSRTIKQFKQYYTSHKLDIEGFISENMVDDNDRYKSEDLNIVLAEIYAFALPMVAKDIRDYLLSK